MQATDHTIGLTQERLKALLRYDPETGHFTWLGSTSRRVKNGTRAGTKTSHGYTKVKVGNRHFMLHRLAWLYMTGAWPPECIDHENLNRADNRWCNLRCATHAENIRNRPAAKNIESGLKGAYLKKDAFRQKPWASVINLGGKLKHLGTFHTPEEANAAYAKAAVEAFGQFARSA